MAEMDDEHNAEEGPPPKPNYVEIAKQAYETLVKAIIRPPRVSAQYQKPHLGRPSFPFLGEQVQRLDFTITNQRNQVLQCSEWSLEASSSSDSNSTTQPSVLIYLHGNSSARLEAVTTNIVSFGLGEAGFTSVCSLDLSGSGQSEGDYVTLGYYEKDDVQALVEFYLSKNTNFKVGLWGRSMGAATALMWYAKYYNHSNDDDDGDISPKETKNDNDEGNDVTTVPTTSFDTTSACICMILDSPYADLPQLCREVVQHGLEANDAKFSIPGFLISLAIQILSYTVYKRAQFGIREITPLQELTKLTRQIERLAVNEETKKKQQQQQELEEDRGEEVITMQPSQHPPILFIAARGDDFIPPHHSEQLLQKYPGIQKSCLVVDGDHNSPRPLEMYVDVALFIQQSCSLQLPSLNWAAAAIEARRPGRHYCPPWKFPTAVKEAPSSNGDAAQYKKPQATATSTTNDNTIGDADEEEAVEIGMTSERQQDIQNNVVTFFNATTGGGQQQGIMATARQIKSMTSAEDDGTL